MAANRDPLDSMPAAFRVVSEPLGSIADEFELVEHEAAIEPISLTKIDSAKVLQALMNGAMRRMALEAADQEAQPEEWLHEASIKEARALLQGLKARAAKTELAGMFWDDQQLEGVPELPGFQPFARVIPVETIAAIDKRYGDRFTANCLRELVAQRDLKFGVGRAAVEASAEAPDQDDALADAPENEFNFRWRDGHLYVGDIPFPYWYGLLQRSAADFVQQLRQEQLDQGGFTDLPDVHPMSNEVHDQLITDVDYLAEHEDEPPIIMRTRTGLPDMTSDDSDIDVELVNAALHQMGYPPERNFVFDALLPALTQAPHRLGPLGERHQVPEPETRAERLQRLGDLLARVSPTSSSPNQPGDDTEAADTDTHSHTAEPLSPEVTTGYMTEYDELKAHWSQIPRGWRWFNQGLYWVMEPGSFADDFKRRFRRKRA